MALTDEQRRTAERLGLTYTEMKVSLDTHIAPEVYARHKAEIRAKREAWEARIAGLGEDQAAGIERMRNSISGAPEA